MTTEISVMYGSEKVRALRLIFILSLTDITLLSGENDFDDFAKGTWRNG